ncbi:5602_t:CDS:1, partial [Paraglomus brasilianum]
MYCQTLEFQFLGTKSSSLSTVTPPWKIKEENNKTPIKKPNSFENQIALIHKTVSQSPPAQISERKVTTTSEKVNVFKVADIAKSLLTKKVEISSDPPCDNNNEEQSPIQSEPPAKRTRRKAN